MYSIGKCDFCGSMEYDRVYRPINTKRDVDVVICKNCGLVYSIVKDIPYSREPNPSGDADWGNIRFCKGQRFGVVKDILPKDVKYILDVGSSRGHFVKWAKANIPDAEITAVEPDTRVIHDYQDEFHVIGKYLEDIELPSNHFDFVYCMQTLEHSDSAAAMLKQIYDALRPGGVVFVEVPNIEVIRYPENVEEFFIDKHNFHFSRTVLCNYMASLGFSIKLNDDPLNVSVFATKTGVKDIMYFFVDSEPHELIGTYAENIVKNRRKLSEIGAKLNDMISKMKVSFFGGNTLFDLLVKYGNLDASKVKCLVDDFLGEIGVTIHGVKVQKSDALRVYNPDTCVVLARYGADIVADKAKAYGIRNIVKFYDLMR